MAVSGKLKRFHTVHIHFNFTPGKMELKSKKKVKKIPTSFMLTAEWESEKSYFDFTEIGRLTCYTVL